MHAAIACASEEEWDKIEKEREVWVDDEDGEFDPAPFQATFDLNSDCPGTCSFPHAANEWLICKDCGKCGSEHYLLSSREWGGGWYGRICPEKVILVESRTALPFIVRRLY